jgi:hypothetical protein
VIAKRVEGDGLGADADAEIHLSAGGSDDRAVAYDIGAVRLGARGVSRERYRLSKASERLAPSIAGRRTDAAPGREVFVEAHFGTWLFVSLWGSRLRNPG